MKRKRENWISSVRCQWFSENKDLPVILFLPFWSWVFNGQSSELRCAPDININFDRYSSTDFSFQMSRQGRSAGEFYELHITSLTFLQVEAGMYLPFSPVRPGLQLLDDNWVINIILPNKVWSAVLRLCKKSGWLFRFLCTGIPYLNQSGNTRWL